MAKSKKPKKGEPEADAEDKQPEPEAKPRSPLAGLNNVQLAYAFMRHVESVGYSLWTEEHEHELYASRSFLYLLKKDVQPTENNGVPEQELYELLGRWFVNNETPKSRRETRNILDELLWIIPKKKFKSSQWCVPMPYRTTG